MNAWLLENCITLACSASSSNTVYIPSLAPMPTGTSTPTATSTPIPSATNTPSIPSQGKMYPIFGTSAACYPPVIVIPYGGSSMSRDVHNAIDLVPSVVYEELNPWTNRNWIDWQTDVVASQCSTVYAATSGTLITSLRDDGTCCDGSIINSEQLPDNFELRYAHIDLNGSLFPFGLAELTTANVVAGQAIGTVRNWREETASSEATHIDIAVRNQFNLSDTPDIQRVLSSKV